MLGLLPQLLPTCLPLPFMRRPAIVPHSINKCATQGDPSAAGRQRQVLDPAPQTLLTPPLLTTCTDGASVPGGGAGLPGITCSLRASPPTHAHPC